MRSFTCFVRSSPKNNSLGSLFAERKDLNSGFKEGVISSCVCNERSYDTFTTIAVMSAANCTIFYIPNFYFCTSVQIFRASATTLTNDFCSMPT